MGIEDDMNGYGKSFSDDIDERHAALEELTAQTLLIELFNAKQAEVFENVVFEGKRRYYIEDLTERDYTLESTTPYQLDILGHAIEEHAWGNLLCRTTELLVDLFPDYRNKLLEFRCTWTKSQIFTLEGKTNYKPIKNGYYMNCNHTALHACWLLQDLLDYFKVDKAAVGFLIHRPSSAEPKKVRDYVEQRFRRNFAEYIITHYQKDAEYADNVIRMIDKYLNPMLVKISKSYTNFFLFDNNATFANYVKKVREMIAGNYRMDDKAKRALNRYLNFLQQYYKEG